MDLFSSTRGLILVMSLVGFGCGDSSEDPNGHGNPDACTGATCPPAMDYDENGCLSYDGATLLCGAGSDGEICGLAATCRDDGNAGQCSIDCEMSSTVGCIDEAAVDCVWQAKVDGDCDALADCAPWYLVY
jgi:hypothetical protein